MGSWNYRIIQYRNKKGFGIHEVYYDDDGKPWGMTEDPRKFIADNPNELISMLELALKDAKSRPVLKEPKKWPGNYP